MTGSSDPLTFHGSAYYMALPGAAQHMTPQRRRAWTFVEDQLGDGEPHPMREIHARAKASGFQRRTLDFALYSLCRVQLIRRHGKPWLYRLPYRVLRS